VLRDQWGVSRQALDREVFPESARVKPMTGVV